MSEIITHYVIVLLLNGTTVKVNHSLFAEDPLVPPQETLDIPSPYFKTSSKQHKNWTGAERKNPDAGTEQKNFKPAPAYICPVCVYVWAECVCVLYWRIRCLHRPVGVCGEQRQAHSAPGLVLSLNPMHSTHSLSHTHTDTYAHTHIYTHILTHIHTHIYAVTLKRGRPGKPGRFN